MNRVGEKKLPEGCRAYRDDLVKVARGLPLDDGFRMHVRYCEKCARVKSVLEKSDDDMRSVLYSHLKVSAENNGRGILRLGGLLGTAILIACLSVGIIIFIAWISR